MHKTNLYLQAVGHLKILCAFIKSYKANPKSMGMLFPSSSFLSKELARQIPEQIISKIQEQVASKQQEEKQFYIVELGAGTGCITKQILSKGVPLNRLIVFENSYEMVRLLRNQFPSLNVVHDDAANMKHYIPKNAQVAVIISSLPFLSLPKNISEAIVKALESAVKNTLLVQYTYSFKEKSFLEERGFKANRKKTVFFNLPPARVINYSY